MVAPPPGMPGPDVQDIAFAADGAVFIASEQGVFRVTDNRLQRVDAAPHPARALLARADGLWVGGVGEVVRIADGKARRSEEHTSELQSLMRISYAVFCLKKKNK